MLTRRMILLNQSWSLTLERRDGVPKPSALHLVTPHERRELEEAVSRGRFPADLERKLCRLGGGSLTDQYVEQSSRLIFSLLEAHYQGLYDHLGIADRDRLLRVLAYVRKDEDAIPDYQVCGFKDDAQEIRAVEAELAAVLQQFKHWRLRHQVPGLWLRGAHASKPLPAAS